MSEPAFSRYSPAQKLFAWSVFPVTFFGSLLLTAYLGAGGWPLRVAPIPAIVGSVLIISVSERILPRYRKWQEPHGDVPTDVLHMLFSQLLPPPLVDGGLQLAMGGVALWLAARAGGGIWPKGWPLPIVRPAWAPTWR